MKYRPFGKLDWKVSALGFGAMRLPVIDKDQSKIDEPEAIKMIRHAIDNGVNYVDTAYPYHAGQSEFVVGKALLDGYREKVKLATKMPAWMVKTADDFDKFLNEQLEKLQTDHIDFYLLHALNRSTWPKLRDMGVLNWAEGAVEGGRIGRLGFSFHDDYDTFKEIVDGYDKWVLCQIQYNYMDVNHQAGVKGLKYAADKGIAGVIMEPLRGGSLTRKAPDIVAELWDSSTIKRSQAEWAIQWVLNQPEAAMALSGMTAMEHVVENLAIADRSGVGLLTDEEQALIHQASEAYIKACPVPCTGCNYCMPCPQGVNIPRIFGVYNEGYMYDNHRTSRFSYRQLPAEAQADKCTACRECMEVCPQDFEIPESLEKAHGWLGPKKEGS
ncbi:MAG: aldo/keto reductase [Desulfobacterales bacterium]